LRRSRPIRTRFRFGSGCKPLSLATNSNSPAHSTKGTPSARAKTPEGINAPRPLTVCRSKVSGFYFTPLPGCFSPFPHGTLHYRSPRVFSLTQWSARIPPRFRVSRGTRVSLRRPVSFRLQGCHLLWRRFPPASANRRFYNFARARQSSINDPTTPRAQRLPTWHAHGLGCSLFDRLY
jgi:hypothetical protein